MKPVLINVAAEIAIAVVAIAVEEMKQRNKEFPKLQIPLMLTYFLSI
jgi:hypothetical protein